MALTFPFLLLHPLWLMNSAHGKSSCMKNWPMAEISALFHTQFQMPADAALNLPWTASDSACVLQHIFWSIPDLIWSLSHM